MKYYTYIYLDTRYPGEFNYDEFQFNFKPIYVGKGKDWRLVHHKNNPPKSHFGNTIRKIISEGLSPEIIKVQDCISEQDAFNLEIRLIKLIGRLDKGTGPLLNMTDGGEGASGHIKSQELRKLISLQKSLLVGDKNPFFGKHHSEETKLKLSGPKSESHKINLSLNHADVSGENNPFFGKTHSKESLNKMIGRVASDRAKDAVRNRNITNNPMKNPAAIAKAKETRRLNKLKKQLKGQEIIS
jgi:group I intron endonuclease